MRILLVDDEPLARERARAMLARETDVSVVGECGSAHEALDAIHAQIADVVLLDINLPGMTGIDVVNAIAESQRPAIIFVTAHERYAVDAFGVKAVDYVLKPFDRERLGQALQRAREYLKSRRVAELESKIASLLERPPDRKPERFGIKTDGKVVFIRPDEIWWIEAANNYSIIHLSDGRRLMLRESIGALEERVGSEEFARIGRSTIVRLDQVQELQPTEYGDYIVVLRSGVRLALSRQLRGRLDLFLPRGS